jgi:hypothetical protein
MRVWLDTEFLDKDSSTDASTQLISIGLVREDGKELYLENAGFVTSAADDWLKKNVLPKLGSHKNRLLVTEIADHIEVFLHDIHPEFWAFYATYDWFLFCKLYGGMMRLPKDWPRMCMDVRQVLNHLHIDADVLGAPRQLEMTKHHALDDARWLRDLHKWVDGNYKLVPTKVRQ